MNNDAIDALKFLMAIAIVAMHSGLFIGSYWLVLLWPWARLCVPLFFMISAYFFFRKHPDGDGIKRFLFRIGSLYLFWFIATLPITLYYRGHLWWHDDGVANCLGRFARSLLLGGTFGASWYLTALAIGMTLVVWMTKKIGDKWTWAVSTSAFFVCCFTSNYWTFLPSNSPLLDSLETFNAWWPRIHNSFPASLLWVCIGRFIALHEPNCSIQCKTLLMWTLISAILLWMEWFSVWYLTKSCIHDCYLLLPPCCATIFLLVKEVKIHIPYALDLRRASVVIFLVHLVAIAPLHDLGFTIGGGLFVASLTISLAVYLLLRVLYGKFKILESAW